MADDTPAIIHLFTMGGQNNIIKCEGYYFDSDLPWAHRELKCIATRLSSARQYYGEMTLLRMKNHTYPQSAERAGPTRSNKKPRSPQ